VRKSLADYGFGGVSIRGTDLQTIFIRVPQFFVFFPRTFARLKRPHFKPRLYTFRPLTIVFIWNTVVE
jgi:hypothetical protein